MNKTIEDLFKDLPSCVDIVRTDDGDIKATFHAEPIGEKSAEVRYFTGPDAYVSFNTYAINAGCFAGDRVKARGHLDALKLATGLYENVLNKVPTPL